MVPRTFYLDKITTALSRSPIVALLGPRQVGKTTLARLFAQDKNASFFDLESRPDQQRLQNPELVLGQLTSLVIIDEIQILPSLFNVLRVLVDRPDNPAQFLILGSASPHIIRHVSESLAGRVEFIELSGFDLREIAVADWQKLWVRGGFPRAFLAENNANSVAWREGFIRTFLERDIPQLGIGIAAPAMRRFWTMLAHYHGQTWNASELARAIGVSGKTIQSYLDILTGTFMVRQLQPWYANVGKRQVKAPKIYLRDSGILHQLLTLPDFQALVAHPAVGASWEGFALEQALQIVRPPEAYFWATHGGAELDLLFAVGGQRYGVEVKFKEAPTITKSMRIALTDLQLNHLWVIYPGKYNYPMDAKITACAITRLEVTLGSLGSQQ